MARVPFQGLIPTLPRAAWALNLGMALNSVGTGMFTAFLLIYLHVARGFSLQTAGLVAATYAGAGMVTGVVAGPLIDRLGARRTAAVSLVYLTAGLGSLFLVQRPWHAFALVGLGGIGRGLFWPSYSSLFVAVTPPSQRAEAYAAQRVTSNLGLGLGGLVAGLIISAHDPTTFTAIFLFNAGTYLAFLVTLLFVREPARPSVAPPHVRAGYRQVVRDRPFVGAVLVGFALTTFGIAQLNSMLPLFAKTTVGVSAKVVGLVFLANTIAIVLTQFPVARVVQGRRRMPVLTVVGAVWACAWLLALGTGRWASGGAAAALIVMVGVVFAVGESLLGVIQGPLVADLAPERLRGRYMAAWLTSNQLGFTIGPAIGGLLLARSATALWSVAALFCLAGGLGSLTLERSLPDEARRTPISDASEVVT